MSHPTLPPSQSALPERGIDRLFLKFACMYGRQWLDLWVDCDVEAVKSEWARAMEGIDNEAIRLALDSILATGKQFPPSMPEFVSLCRQFTRRGPHRLALVDNRRDAGPKAGFATLRTILKRAKESE